MAQYFVAKDFAVKGSTRSSDRVDRLKEEGVQPFIIDLANGTFGLSDFFDSETLIINIPFKGVSEFSALIGVIENSNVANVIFVSSTSVYGNKEGVISEEDFDCLKPCALLDIENLFTSNKNFCTTIVRFGGLIGYSRNPALFFKNNRSVPNPESTVNMIHRDDCINILYLITEKNAWGKIYNCCADTHPTKRAFYTHAATVSNVPVPHFSEDNEDSYKVIGNVKVKEDLSYRFLHSNLLDLKF